MGKRVLTAIRFFAPRLSERLRLWRKARETRALAYREARELCAVAGPWAVACSYVGARVREGQGRSLSLRRIAEAYARAAHRPEVFEAARDGALAGFEDFNRHRVALAGSAANKVER
ncbi:MAG TPA: hypothetical protein VLC07_03595 [Solirubrobacterales bacterium]|nr:hypothetical protein [Solirubrobacterales bacterium]